MVEVESVALRGSEVSEGFAVGAVSTGLREGDDLGRDLGFCEVGVGVAELRGGCTTGGGVMPHGVRGIRGLR